MKKNFRKRRAEEDDHAFEDEEERRLALEEIKFLQRQRERERGNLASQRSPLHKLLWLFRNLPRRMKWTTKRKSWYCRTLLLKRLPLPWKTPTWPSLRREEKEELIHGIWTVSCEQEYGSRSEVFLFLVQRWN